MSSDGAGRCGAVDHMGRVFIGEGREVHEGLVCIDSSIIPTSLGTHDHSSKLKLISCHTIGANPLATITALAERNCELLLSQRGWVVDESPNGKLDLFGEPRVSHAGSDTPSKRHARTFDTKGVRFTEVMKGYIHMGSEISDFRVACNVAEGAANSASLYITVDVTSPTSGDSCNASQVAGTFSCGTLSQNPLMIIDGTINFFIVDNSVSDSKNLVYDLMLASTEGKTYFFHGTKIIDSSIAFSMPRTWKATTTLYATITGLDGSLVGRGILNITIGDFIRELRSFRSIPPAKGLAANMSTIAPFVNFWLRNLTPHFLAPFRSLQFPGKDTTGYLKKPIPARTATLVADDDVRTIIKVWHPAAHSSKRHTPILFLPGASVDDQIFSLLTVPTNTIDYFTQLGYTCYVATLRFGKLDAAQRGYTAYDARLDVRAAMQFVREMEGNKKFYVVCHCLGSIATGMALLSGTVDAGWIRGMTCSQVFTHLRFAKVNRIKARTQFLERLYQVRKGNMFLDTAQLTFLL